MKLGSKKQILIQRLFLVCSLLLSQTTWAQPWYEIEVVVFGQDFPDLAAASTTEEIWPTEIQLAWREPLLPMFESEWQVTPALRKLPINSRRMNGDAYAFRVTEGYRLLWHQAWLQPLVDEADAPWLIVEGGDQVEGRYELEGSLRIHLSRFLHMTADLWLTDFDYPLFPVNAEQQELSEPEFFLHQLPEKPKLYNPCSYLRFQPETPQEEPEDILQDQPAFESWWTAPYECNSPRSNLDRGKPLYAPMLPVSAPQMQQISYTAEFSTEPVELEIALPEFSVSAALEPSADLTFSEEVSEDLRPVAQITQINMNRRLRSEEYHFVDHPKLGILIRILEVEAPIIESDTDPALAE